jgi:hypothetical protein
MKPYYLITAHYKARKVHGSDGYSTFAINEHPAAWMILSRGKSDPDFDNYYEKPNIIFAIEITEAQYHELKQVC